MRVLAVGAHPDDAELGCGATLARLVAEGHQVAILVLSRGEVGGDPEVRVAEAFAAAAALGVKDVRVADLPDTHMEEGLTTIREIERSVQAFRPDVVIGHSTRDIHQDHRNAAMATLSACRSVRSILSFESPSISLGFQPSLFVDVSAHFARKRTALEAFRSQIGKRYFSPQALEGLARFRGNQVGHEYAEAFEVYRISL